MKKYDLINFKFKIDEIGMSYKEFKKILNKDISFLSAIDMESEIRNNYRARDKFLIHIIACKEELEERVEIYLKENPNDEMKYYSKKLFSFTSCSLFNEFIIETPKWKELNVVLNIIFIKEDLIIELYEKIKCSLEEEKNTFEEKEYLDILKNEFCDALKNL